MRIECNQIAFTSGVRMRSRWDIFFYDFKRVQGVVLSARDESSFELYLTCKRVSGICKKFILYYRRPRIGTWKIATFINFIALYFTQFCYVVYVSLGRPNKGAECT